MLQASAYVIALFIVSLFLLVGIFMLLWGTAGLEVKQTAVYPTDWLEAGFTALVAGIVLTGWLAVLLASFGYFSLLRLALLLLGIGLLLVVWKRPFSFPTWPRPGWHEGLLLILLLGVSLIYLRPHEYVLGGNDPGTYMHIAASVVRTGSFVVEDEWTPLLRQHAEVTLREQPAHWQTRYLQFVGWYIDDDNPCRLIPQFFPFHPLLLAVGMAVGGFYGGLFVTPLWALLGLVAVYLLVRRLFDPGLALLATTLLALTPTHIYFARYPSTEPLTLLLLFTGLLAFQILWDDEGGRPFSAAIQWGILGGASLGAATLTRIDLPLIVGLVMAMLLLRRWQKRWSVGWTAYSLTLGIFLLHALLSTLLINWPYAWNTYGSVANLLNRSPWLAGLLALTAIGGAVVAVTLWQKPPWLNEKGARAIQLSERLHGKRVVGLGLVLLSAYAYFLRPIIEPARTSLSWPTGAEAWILNGENWVRMGWYLTPLGLLLATLGAAWLVQKVSWQRFGLFLSVGLLTTVQYVYQIFNTPYHIYTMRRYVPVVIPMLMIYAAVALFGLYRQPGRWPARASGPLLALLLVGGLLYQSRYVLPLRDYYGTSEQLTALQTHLRPEAIIVISEPPQTLFVDRFGTLLRFVYGHDVATIRQDGEAARTFIEEMVAYAEQQGKPLQLLGVRPVWPVMVEELAAQPVAFVPVRLPLLENTYTGFPAVVQTVYYGLELYDLEPQTAVSPLSSLLPLTIDVGNLDIVYIEEGVYAKEPLPGPITMRWTTERAVFTLPIAEETAVTLHLQAMIYRPAGVPEADVVVELDDVKIGRFVPDQVWQTYTFSAQAQPVNGRSRLVLHTTPFNPAALQISGDNRNLGFLLDSITIAPISTSLP
jgi:4-amino-4-deoxy-L-arabinose transferase-like glycosyltransferase